VLQIFRLCLLALLALPAILSAQSLRGAIGGHVFDPSGHAVPGAGVVVTSDDTSRRRETVSTPSGDFLVSLLQPGRYNLEISKTGFQPYRRTLIVEVNQQTDLSVVMALEGQQASIEVNAPAPLLRTESASAGGVITTQQLVDLPLNGRNYYELSLLLPGVAPAAQGSAGSVRGDFAINVNGAREDSTNFLLDGVYNGDPKLNGVGLTSPVDAIREFEVSTSTYDASFGRNAGSQVNVVLRSGSNGFHGSAWYFLRNTALDARNFFAPAGEPDPRYQRNQFGASAGGPIKKNRTFWFADYEGLTVRGGASRLTSVPTALERSGDFSQSPGVPYVIDPFTQMPFPGNKIPANRIHPVGQNIINLYPLPNRSSSESNYASAPVGKDNSQSFDVKIDHSWTPRSEFSARYSFSDRDLYEPFAGANFAQVPGYGNNVPRTAQNAMISETHVFTPALLNEARLSYSRVALNVTQQNQAQSINRQIGLQQIWSDPRDNGLSLITNLGYSPLGDEYNNPQSGVTNTYTIVDNVTWVRGAHQFKFGGEVHKLEQNAYRDIQSRGFLNFLGFTGSSLSDLLQGLPAYTGGARLDNPQHLRTEGYSLFAQSSFQLRRDLKLTAGIRYEYNSPAVDPQDRATLYNPATGGLSRVGTEGLPRSGYLPDGNNLAPRVGFAWNPGSRGTVIRGGYGIYFDQSSLAPSEGLYFSPPFYDFRFYFTSQYYPLTLSNPFPADFPIPVPGSAFSIERALRTPYVQQWNFHIQQQLGSNRTIEVGYIGSKGTHVQSARDFNQPAPSPVVPNLRPNPRFDDINRLESGANSNYNSLQSTFTQRFDRGLSVLAAYTLGKSIDDASSFFPSTGDPNFPQDSNNRALDRARSNFDVRQRLSLAASWLIPGKVHGFQINGIYTVQTGRPFTVALPSEVDNSNTGRSSLGFGANDRPNVLSDARLSNPTPERWFNTSAFAPSPFGTFGNVGRNTLDGPGSAVLNLSLLKNFRLREAATLQFRAESFNALNRANFNLPQNFVGAAGFGSITSAQAARQIQFGMKILF
jgi:hypothetical protein